MSVNAHRVFGSSNKDSYLNALDLDPKQLEELRKAKDEVRDCIRSGFAEWGKITTRAVLFESGAGDAPEALRPKFRLQGSYAYKTLNEPAHIPPQQVDLDDGVFLPVSFFDKNGTLTPAIASAGYFRLTEQLLAPLCKQKGWTLVTDKKSCVRIEFDDQMHMDLALYSIPEKEFVLLVEKVEKANANASFAMDSRELYNEVYAAIPKDHIMLAHREKGWMPSDPRKLDDWFHESLDKHGEQYRSVCRYLKGWRDFQWEESRLSSIILMTCVRKLYDDGHMAGTEKRDDLALAKVAQHLPQLLEHNIENPVVPGLNLDEWSPNERAEYVNRAFKLSISINKAIGGNDPKAALNVLQDIFGDRIPDDVNLVDTGSSVGAPTILTSGILRGLEEDPSVKSAVQLGSDQRYG